MQLPQTPCHGRALRFRTGWIAAAGAVLLIVLASASMAPATNPWAYLARSSSGMLFFNVWSLGYSPLASDQVFWLQHEAEAIDFVRRGLVRQGKIQNLPVLVSFPRTQKSSWISLDPDCTVSEGQSGKLIGRCYVVGYVDPDVTPGRRDGHENLLALTASLAQLSPAKDGIDVDDLDAVRTTLAAETAPFKGIVHHFDPIWSPDGRDIIYLVWEDGRVWFELFDPSSRAVRQLEPLRGYVAARPVWSPDSRYVAVASLRDVRIVDVRTGKAKAIRPAGMSERFRATIALNFERDGRLLLMFDMSEPTGPLYATYSYNLDSQELRLLATGAPPSWVGRLGDWMAAHAALHPVRSPTGQHVAFVRYVNGLRRVAVQSLR